MTCWNVNAPFLSYCVCFCVLRCLPYLHLRRLAIIPAPQALISNVKGWVWSTRSMSPSYTRLGKWCWTLWHFVLHTNNIQVFFKVFIWPYLHIGKCKPHFVSSHTDLISTGLMCRPVKWTEQQMWKSTIWLETLHHQRSSLLQLEYWPSSTVPAYLWCMWATSMYTRSQPMAQLLWVYFNVLSTLGIKTALCLNSVTLDL